MITAAQLAHIERLEISTRRLVDEILAGDYRSVFKGRGLDFEELRAYEPGDDLRTIDWNVTARLGTTHVRQYREERELNVIVALDVSASGSFGSLKRSKLERARDAATAFVFAATQQRDRAGLALFTDRAEAWVPPSRGRLHALRLARTILGHQPLSKGTSLSGLVSFLDRRISRRSVVVLIGDFLDEGYEDALAVLGRRHDLIPIVVRDPRENELPDLGPLLLSDAETGRQALVDTGSPELRRAYAQRQDEARKRRSAAFQRAGCVPLELDHDESLYEALRHFLRMRARASRAV